MGVNVPFACFTGAGAAAPPPRPPPCALLHAVAHNPAPQAYDPAWRAPAVGACAEQFVALPAGVHRIGFSGAGYSFDN